MVGSLEMQDCYSASALMQLQGSGEAAHQDIAVTASMEAAHLGGHLRGNVIVSGAGNMEGQWPLIMFDGNQGQGS